MHSDFRHVLLGENDGQFLGSVVAEVEENNHVALGDRTCRSAVGGDNGDGFDEFVGHSVVIRLLHGFDRVGEWSAFPFDKQVVGLTDSFPAFVAVHGIITSHNGGNASGRLGRVSLQGFNEPFPAFGVGVASVHKAVDIGFLQIVFFGDVAEFVQVFDGAVHSPVRHQAHEVDSLTAVASGGECLHDGRVLPDAVVAAGAVDFDQVLVDHPACSDIEMSYFRVAHLSVRQTHVFT